MKLLLILILSFTQVSDTTKLKTIVVDSTKIKKEITKKVKKDHEKLFTIIQLGVVAIPTIVIETFSPDK